MTTTIALTGRADWNRLILARSVSRDSCVSVFSVWNIKHHDDRCIIRVIGPNISRLDVSLGSVLNQIDRTHKSHKTYNFQNNKDGHESNKK
jgi:hypothetical protein